jgi:Ca2+-binding RTX toxin-like protein
VGLLLAGLLLPVSAEAVPGPVAGAVRPAATCGGQRATVVGTRGDDVLVGTRGRDVIAGRGGDDVVRGGRGDDLLCGDAGADTVLGGRGDDAVRDLVVRSDEQRLDGGPGHDRVWFAWEIREDGELQPVVLRTDLGSGTATIGETGLSFPFASFREVTALMSAGTWEVRGTRGPDVYTVAQYMSVDARTRAGRDVVRGSWHDDTIHGGPGRDTAHASRGRDVCVSVERGPLGECETRT